MAPAPRAEIRSRGISFARPTASGRFRLLAFTCVVTMFPLITWVALKESRSWWVMYAWMTVCVASCVAAWALDHGRAREGTLRVHAGRVSVETDARRASFPCDEVVEVRVALGIAEAFLELRHHGGTVWRARVESLDEAHAWLDAADLALHRRVSRVVLGPAWHTWGFLLGYSLLGLVVGPMLATPVLWVLAQLIEHPPTSLMQAVCLIGWAAFTSVATARSAPPRVDVGTDGVVVRHGFSKRFYAYDAVADAAAIGNGVLMIRVDAGPKGLKTLRLKSTVPNDLSASMAAAAIEYARVRRERLRGAADLGLLERNGRSVDAWRASMRELLAAQSPFRGAALDREVVHRVLEDPTASHERRVGAALVLAEAGDEARTRVRVVIEGCAHEPLCAALRGVLDGALDDDALRRVRGAA